MPDHSRAVLLLLLTACLWSTGGLLIKWITWHPLAIAGMRSAIAGVFLWVVLGQPRFTWSWPQLSGACAHAASVLLFVTATKLTTAANAIVLVYTAPIYVALCSAWVLHEPVRRIDWLTIALVLGGMLLFFLDQLTLEGWWGNVCAIGGGIAFAWLVLCLRKQSQGSPLETVLLGNGLAALVGVPFMFETSPGLTGWLALGVSGTLQIGVSFVLYTIAIKRVNAVEAVLIPVIEPLLNPLWVLLVLGEMPDWWAMVGGAVILSALTIRGLVLARVTPTTVS
ncbi:MAG: EamA/RhaT family transporter [Candidatus Tectomicrobia bacterium]|uniref:EamA/RhaT family transporter n=1 Tax=Tectimicrobiota bacterium TaxID=2528274 RepID=A0A937W171_UNCTE|nr:EamA/RhaT family transporter [Candidatus Tectomicrobia bacterium]